MNPTAKPTNPIAEHSPGLTVDQLKATMPKRQKHNITQSLVDTLNKLVSDPDERDQFRENLLSYTHVLQDPNVKLESYIHAVKYVSYKHMGLNNQQSWIKTFPDRYQSIIDRGKSAGHLRATVSSYNANKIVNQVWEQSLIAPHIYNADVFQDAVKVQAELMIDPNVSHKVRSDAANSLMTHLKAPESRKIELDVTHKEDDSLRDLTNAIEKLSIDQRRLIEAGGTDAERIAAAKIIPGDSERID